MQIIPEVSSEFFKYKIRQQEDYPPVSLEDSPGVKEKLFFPRRSCYKELETESAGGRKGESTDFVFFPGITGAGVLTAISSAVAQHFQG